MIQTGQDEVEGTAQLGAFVVDTGGFAGLSDEFARVRLVLLRLCMVRLVH